MILQVNKTITETLDIPTPSYYRWKYGNKVIHITENEDVVLVQKGMVMIWKKEEAQYRDSVIFDAMSDTHEPCTADDFEQAFNEALDIIKTVHEAQLIPQP